MLMTSKIIITGGLGYIGSHTIVELKDNVDEFIVIDDLFDEDSQEELMNFFDELESDEIQPILDEFKDEYEEDDLKLFRLYHYCKIAF